MIEIISSFGICAVKYLATVFSFMKIDTNAKNGYSILFGLMGLKNFILIALALSLPKYFGFDKQYFILSFMLFYFIFLVPELMSIKKIIYKREELKKGKINE